MKLFEEAYDFLSEASRNEPNYVKIMKWAISIHFNSPKPDADGTPQTSHIGNWFDTVRFKDWLSDFEPNEGRPVQLAITYDAALKGTVLHGSSKVDTRTTYTVIYGIDGIPEIKQAIKTDPDLQKSLEKDQPTKDAAASLHELAETYVRYAQFYFGNKLDTPELTVPQTRLPMLGVILQNSELLPKSIRRTGEKGEKKTAGYTGPSVGYIYTVPADRQRLMNAQFNLLGELRKQLTEIGPDGKERTVYKPGGADEYSYRDENGDRVCGIATNGSYGRLFVQRLQDEGIIDGFKQVSLLNNKGEVGRGGIRRVMDKKPDNAAAGSGRKASTGPKAAAITFACDSAAFADMTRLANRMVTGYNAQNNGNASVTSDNDAESITVNGLNKKTIDQLVTIFDRRGFKYSKM